MPARGRPRCPFPRSTSGAPRSSTSTSSKGWWSATNAIFQTIFTLVFQKIGDHVYDFIDRVVLHLSPETLPYLSGMNMVNEARIAILRSFAPR